MPLSLGNFQRDVIEKARPLWEMDSTYTWAVLNWINEKKKSCQQLSAKHTVVTVLSPVPYKIGSSQTTTSKSCPRQALLGVFSHIDKNICNALSKAGWGEKKVQNLSVDFK